MSDPVAPLTGASFEGYVTVSAATAPMGMITIRADLAALALAQALAALSLPLPGQRRIETAGDASVAWMSPDELLVMVPYGTLAATMAQLNAALAGQHALIVDVSDARALFHIRGDHAAEVLAKICPVDLAPSVFGIGEMRRTRAAQVACALWQSAPGEFHMICFRSVAVYVFDLLKTSAMPGGEAGVFHPA